MERVREQDTELWQILMVRSWYHCQSEEEVSVVGGQAAEPVDWRRKCPSSHYVGGPIMLMNCNIVLSLF